MAVRFAEPLEFEEEEEDGAEELHDDEGGEDREEEEEPELNVAARQGDQARIREAVRAVVDAADNIGRTPLHEAAAAGRDATVELLLSVCASVDVTDDDGWTPLHFACREGHEIAARLLIDAGADLEAVDGRLCTPLHVAAEAGKADIATLLLGEGANINARDENSCQPHHLAAWEGRLAVMRQLLDSGADIDAVTGKGNPLLLLACIQGHPDVARFLVEEKGVDVNAKGDMGATGLQRACDDHPGKVEIMRLLLAHGADVNAADGEGDGAIYWAAQMGSEEQVTLLIESGADIDMRADGGTALHHACGLGAKRLNVAVLLIEAGATIDDSLDEELCTMFMPALQDLFRRGRTSMNPLEPHRRTLRWLLNSPAVAAKAGELKAEEEAARAASASSRRNVPGPAFLQAQRNSRLALLRDDGWERRKHVVCAYALLREARRGQGSTRRAAKAANSEAAPPASTTEAIAPASKGRSALPATRSSVEDEEEDDKKDGDVPWPSKPLPDGQEPAEDDNGAIGAPAVAVGAPVETEEAAAPVPAGCVELALPAEAAISTSAASLKEAEERSASSIVPEAPSSSDDAAAPAVLAVSAPLDPSAAPAAGAGALAAPAPSTALSSDPKPFVIVRLASSPLGLKLKSSASSGGGEIDYDNDVDTTGAFVESVTAGKPAALGGVQAGWKLLSMDGRDVSRLRASRVQELLADRLKTGNSDGSTGLSAAFPLVLRFSVWV